MNTQRFYSIQARGTATAEIFIYGDIGENFWEPEKSNTAEALIADLAKLKGKSLTVRLNSFGGSLVDGIAIYNALRRHQGQVDVEIDAVAYSAASLIAMAGKEIRMAENSLLMIHSPWTTTSGNAVEHRQAADMLDKYSDAIISAYAREGGPDADIVGGWLKDGQDHYFTSQEALEAGLIDRITDAVDVAASLKGIPTTYRLPENPMPKESQTTSGDNVLEIQNKARSDQLVELKARNAELVKIFALPVNMSIPGMSALKDKILADPSISLDAAREMILNKLGEGAEPINSPAQHSYYSSNPSIHLGANTHHADFRHAAIDAMLIRAGIPVEDAHPAAKDLRGRSAVNIAEMFLAHSGRTFSDFGGGSPNEIVRAALTTSDYPELLSGVASKSLMLGYENEPASHRLWTREVEIQDFKPTKRVAVSEAPELLEIPEHGNYEEGALSERAESYQLKTYGRLMALSRQAIVNDDLGAFTRIPLAFGAAAARKEADMVYALLTGNPNMSDGNPLFDATHSNLETAAALSVDSLSSARKAMRSQKGIGGMGFLNVVPRYLIVPATLESQALLIVANEHFERTTSGDTVRSGLEWVKNLEVIVDPRLDDDSTTSWYLVASFNQVDTIEVAHLAGQRGVFTDDEVLFSSDVYRIKARLDFATQVIDWVGLVKNPGA